MSLSWRREVRFDLSSFEQVQDIPGHGRITVVLSSHLVRYAVLPWSATLSGESEWMAFARHSFAATYGDAAASWSVRLCPTGRRKPRVACAVEASLLDALGALKNVVSVQPALMAEFNARRREFGEAPGWFVVRERGRLTVGLVAELEWKLVRVRQAQEDWRTRLPDLLAREAAIAGLPPCDRVVLAEH